MVADLRIKCLERGLRKMKLKSVSLWLLVAIFIAFAGTVPAQAQSTGSNASPADKKADALIACATFVGQFKQMDAGQAMRPDFTTGLCLPALAGKPFGILNKPCSDPSIDLLSGLVIMLKPGAPKECQVYYPKEIPTPPAVQPERMRDFSGSGPYQLPAPQHHAPAASEQPPAQHRPRGPSYNMNLRPEPARRPASVPLEACWADADNNCNPGAGNHWLFP